MLASFSTGTGVGVMLRIWRAPPKLQQAPFRAQHCLNILGFAQQRERKKQTKVLCVLPLLAYISGMSLDDDDVPTAAPVVASAGAGAGASASTDAEEGLTADEVLEEEAQDFRLFRKNTHISAQTIRKGEKDFESHGTRAQESALEQSRLAMRDVLSYTRVHAPQNWVRGWYFPDRWADWTDEDEEAMAAATGKDGERRPCAHVRDRVVLLEGSSVASMNLGRAVTGQPKDKPARGMDWLLPEEALYLVERGSLDLWWPTRGLGEIFPPPATVSADQKDGVPGQAADINVILEDDDEDEADEYEKGFPLGLQAAYSLLIGNDGERGKVSLRKFQVYSNLKRAGYNVLRAPPIQKQQQQQQTKSSPPPPPPPTRTFWQWLSSLLSSRERSPKSYGPLVQPGLYRSYVPIYRQMAIVPRHQPSPTPLSPWQPIDPFAIHYYVWKAAQKWSKLRHPPPDFYLAVVDAQQSAVPSFEGITALLDATPSAPGKPEWTGPGRLYARLKHGHRNVLVAVNDHGIINYMRFAEGAFGEERLFERFDSRTAPRGGKKGGGRNGSRGGRGGRGGGRGRGRGRGGR